MPTDAASPNILDAPLESSAGPVVPEYAGDSTIPVNSILARKRTPNSHRGRIALVGGLSALALLAVAAGALAVMSRPDAKTTTPATPLNVESTTTPLPTTSASTGAAIAPAAAEPGAATTTTSTSTAVAPAAPIARRSRLSPPATAPMPGRGPSDAAPAARAAPAPIATVPPPVAAQPETPATTQLAPVVGPATAPAPPPAQPVTPQTSATPQPQPATPQPQAASDDIPAPTLAKLPLSAILSQKT